MKKLRDTIAQYRRWQDLGLYIDRIEGHLESDFSISVENAKALLESIGKEICQAKSVTLGTAPSINAVIKAAFRSLGYTSEDLVNKISGALATIGQEIGNLRNEISPTSHGKLLDELRERNNKVDHLTREFLIDSTLIVATLLIRTFEERQEIVAVLIDPPVETPVIKYVEAEEFNENWDDAYGEFDMGIYSYTASEILYNVDYQAYETEYKAFLENDVTETEEQQA